MNDAATEDGVRRQLRGSIASPSTVELAERLGPYTVQCYALSIRRDPRTETKLFKTSPPPPTAIKSSTDAKGPVFGSWLKHYDCVDVNKIFAFLDSKNRC